MWGLEPLYREYLGDEYTREPEWQLEDRFGQGEALDEILKLFLEEIIEEYEVESGIIARPNRARDRRLKQEARAKR